MSVVEAGELRKGLTQSILQLGDIIPQELDGVRTVRGTRLEVVVAAAGYPCRRCSAEQRENEWNVEPHDEQPTSKNGNE